MEIKNLINDSGYKGLRNLTAVSSFPVPMNVETGLYAKEDEASRSFVVNWDYILVPRNVELMVTSRNGLELLLRAVAANEETRELLADFLSNHVTMTKVFELATHTKNSQVRIGSKVTSVTSLLEAVKGAATLPDSVARVATLIIADYAKIVGIILEEDDWGYAYSSLSEAENVSKNIQDELVALSISSALKRRPVASNFKSGVTTTYELAREFVTLHNEFVNYLITTAVYDSDMSSFFSRLRTYIKKNSSEVFGPDARVFLEDSNFRMLAGYYNFITEALDRSAVDTRSSSTVWPNEDRRILDLINSLDDLASLKRVTKHEFMKFFSVNIVKLRKTGIVKAVVIESQIDSSEKIRIFRKIKSGQMDRYVYEKRSEGFLDRYMDYKDRMRPGQLAADILTRVVDEGSKCEVITIGVSKYLLIAYATALTSAFISTASNSTDKVVYGLPLESAIRLGSGIVTKGIKDAYTTSPITVLAALAEDAIASNPLVSYSDLYNPIKGKRYVYTNIEERALSDINFGLDVGEKPLNDVISVQEAYSLSRTGSYVIINRVIDFIYWERFRALSEYFAPFGNDRLMVFWKAETVALLRSVTDIPTRLVESKLWKQIYSGDLDILSYRDDDEITLAVAKLHVKVVSTWLNIDSSFLFELEEDSERLFDSLLLNSITRE